MKRWKSAYLLRGDVSSSEPGSRKFQTPLTPKDVLQLDVRHETGDTLPGTDVRAEDITAVTLVMDA